MPSHPSHPTLSCPAATHASQVGPGQITDDGELALSLAHGLAGDPRLSVRLCVTGYGCPAEYLHACAHAWTRAPLLLPWWLMLGPSYLAWQQSCKAELGFIPTLLVSSVWCVPQPSLHPFPPCPPASYESHTMAPLGSPATITPILARQYTRCCCHSPSTLPPACCPPATPLPPASLRAFTPWRGTVLNFMFATPLLRPICRGSPTASRTCHMMLPSCSPTRHQPPSLPPMARASTPACTRTALRGPACGAGVDPRGGVFPANAVAQQYARWWDSEPFDIGQTCR